MAEPSMPGPPPANERPAPRSPAGPPPPSPAGTVGASHASGTSHHSLVASWAVVLVSLMLGMLFFWIGFYADPRAFLVLGAIVVIILFFMRRIATTRKEQKAREERPGTIGPPA